MDKQAFSTLEYDKIIEKLKEHCSSSLAVKVADSIEPLDDPVEIWEEHEEFYYENCTQCHAAHEPKTHSMLEWDAILQDRKSTRLNSSH